jgi:hypothetical protein
MMAGCWVGWECRPWLAKTHTPLPSYAYGTPLMHPSRRSLLGIQEGARSGMHVPFSNPRGPANVDRVEGREGEEGY